VVASAAALPVFQLLGPAEAGVVLGGAFTLGTLAGLLFQVTVLKGLGSIPPWRRPTFAASGRAAHEGGLVMLTLFPAFAFYRGQVLVSSLLLGTAATGLFIYAKQIVNAVLQSLFFVQRSSFPRLVRAVERGASLEAVFRAQRVLVVAGVASAIAMAGAGFALWRLLPDRELAAAALLVMSFAPAILLTAFYIALHQALLAAGRTSQAAIVANLWFAAASALTVAGAALFGLYGLPVAEGLTILLTLIVLVRWWNRRYPSERAIGT